MGECWGYYCQTCNEATKTLFKNGTDYLLALKKINDAVLDFGKEWGHIAYHIELSVASFLGSPGFVYYEPNDFLNNHEGHKIIIKSDYGNVIETDSKLL